MLIIIHITVFLCLLIGLSFRKRLTACIIDEKNIMSKKRKFPEVIGVRLSTVSLEKLDQLIGVLGANSRSEFLRSKIENIIQLTFNNKKL